MKQSQFAAVLTRRDRWVRMDDPRLEAIRVAGGAPVVDCVVATDGDQPAIETLVFGPDGEAGQTPEADSRAFESRPTRELIQSLNMPSSNLSHGLARQCRAPDDGDVF
ncbi:hypothetical protein ACF06Q_27950 [Streptomyces leeuwenhoekii]|uniref:hypothetical protein n=1 Tax=Streptomyces leeuwenhoekii TaxID=1437453 RepID=UPI0036F876E2